MLRRDALFYSPSLYPLQRGLTTKCVLRAAANFDSAGILQIPTLVQMPTPTPRQRQHHM